MFQQETVIRGTFELVLAILKATNFRYSHTL